MKFDQFIEYIYIYYTYITFFLKNHTQDVAEKIFPDPLLKNQN